MASVRVCVSYKLDKKSALGNFASGVLTNLTDNPSVFPDLPVDPTVFMSLITDQVHAYGIYKQGGLAQKPAFQQARAAVLNALDQTAKYVDSVANGNEGVIIQAGFKATKGTKTQKKAPGQCTDIVVQHVSTGKMSAMCAKDPLAESYVCIVTEGAALPTSVSINKEGSSKWRSCMNKRPTVALLCASSTSTSPANARRCSGAYCRHALLFHLLHHQCTRRERAQRSGRKDVCVGVMPRRKDHISSKLNDMLRSERHL
jgi:hypothetical protein